MMALTLLLTGCAGPGKATAQQEGVKAGVQTTSTANTVQRASARILDVDDLKALKWRSIGPANMSGRVADIAIAPGNMRTFFVAFATGGLFKTTNGGTTFSPVFDKEATSCIGSVAVADAPADWSGWRSELSDAFDTTDRDELIKKGKAKIVWVGTGEGNNRNSSSWGNGVYVSTDGGSTFEHVGLADSHDIPRLAVHPKNPDVCYVAALGHLWGPNKMRGVFKTTDRGASWTPVLQIDENTGACDVLLDPSNPDTIYAAMYMRQRTAYSFQSGGAEGGLYRSDDAGDSWKKLSGGLPGSTGRIGLDIYAKDSSVLFAVIESNEGGWGVNPYDNRSKSGGVFRTDDRGETWTRINEMAMRPFYFSKIRIDPGDDQRIYQLGWGLAVSDDGGRHFRAGGASKPHVDMHAMVIDPDDSDHLLLGSDGGIYTSYDRGKTWDFINHIAAGQFYNIAVDNSDPYRVGGGLQDNGSWIGPSRTKTRIRTFSPGESNAGISNSDWTFIHGGDGFGVAFDPVDPNIVYAESQGGHLARIHLDTGVRKSIYPSAKEGQPGFRFNWNAPFFISPHDHTVLYLGGNHVFKLTGRGEYWKIISPDLSDRDIDEILTIGSEAETHGTVVSLAESRLQKGLIFAGTDDGLIHITNDGGASWRNMTPPQVSGYYVSKIEPSHHDAETAYAAIDGHRSDRMTPLVLMTTDGGTSWQNITGNLPEDAPVKVIREDVHNANVLYAGSEHAIHVSIDRGKHWVKLNGDTLPTVSVDDLAQQPRENDLIAGTHGRSVYILDDASPLSQLTQSVMDSPLHLFAIRDAKPILYLDAWGFWGDRMFTADNPPSGAGITYWLRDYDRDSVSITISNADGREIRKLTGTNERGLNRVMWDLLPDEKDRFPNPDVWLGQLKFVPSGTYTIKVTQGERTVTGEVFVRPAPNASKIGTP